MPVGRADKAYIAANVADDGRPSLEFVDDSGRLRVWLGSWSSDEPTLCMTSRNGEVSVWVGFDEDGRPMMGQTGAEAQPKPADEAGEDVSSS